MARGTRRVIAGYLMASGALGGCMLATPPTGLCLLDACRSFEADRSALNTRPRAAPTAHQAPDYELVYPSQWEPLSLASRDASGKEQTRPAVDLVDPTGMTLRLAVGRAIPLDGGGQTAETMRVLTIDRGLDASSTIEVFARAVAVAGLQGRPEGTEGASSLAGQAAHQVTAIGTNAGGGPTMRYIVRALVHRGRGYLVLLAVPEALYGSASSVYDRLFDGFKLKDGDPPYSPPPKPPVPPPTEAPPGPSPSASPAGSPSSPPPSPAR